MKKMLLVLIIILTGCKSEVDILEDEIVIENSTITEYYINAQLDDELDTLTVNQTINYYNDKDTLNEIYMNMYAAEINIDREDGIFEISSFVVNGKEKDFEIDRTVIHFDLDESLEVGDNLEIEISYKFKFWTIDRLAEINGDYIAMFFYPYVAYYDGEWHTDNYSFQGESYFNDSGNYFVNLQVPNGYELATAGEIKSVEEAKGTDIYRIELLNARDYSFSLSESYQRHERFIEDVYVTIMTLRPLNSNEVDRIFNITESMIKFTEENIGDYPYPTLTLEFGHIYGMESSSIIYCSQQISDITLIHELYHQWFYSIIGNDQGSVPWLDEGVTTFATGLFLEEEYPDLYPGYMERYDTSNDRYITTSKNSEGLSAIDSVHSYDSNYGFMVYVYGSTVLNMYLEEFLDGDNEAMLNILSEYYDEYKHQEASIEDLLTIFEEVSGIDGTKEWFYEHLEEYHPLDAVQ